MKRFLLLFILAGAVSFAQGYDTCVVSGTVYGYDGKPAAYAQLTVYKVTPVGTGPVLSNKPRKFAANRDGYIVMPLLRNSVDSICGDVQGFDNCRNITIPNTATADLYTIATSAYIAQSVTVASRAYAKVGTDSLAFNPTIQFSPAFQIRTGTGGAIYVDRDPDSSAASSGVSAAALKDSMNAEMSIGARLARRISDSLNANPRASAFDSTAIHQRAHTWTAEQRHNAPVQYGPITGDTVSTWMRMKTTDSSRTFKHMQRVYRFDNPSGFQNESYYWGWNPLGYDAGPGFWQVWEENFQDFFEWNIDYKTAGGITGRALQMRAPRYGVTAGGSWTFYNSFSMEHPTLGRFFESAYDQDTTIKVTGTMNISGKLTTRSAFERDLSAPTYDSTVVATAAWVDTLINRTAIQALQNIADSLDVNARNYPSFPDLTAYISDSLDANAVRQAALNAAIGPYTTKTNLADTIDAKLTRGATIKADTASLAVVADKMYPRTAGGGGADTNRIVFRDKDVETGARSYRLRSTNATDSAYVFAGTNQKSHVAFSLNEAGGSYIEIESPIATTGTIMQLGMGLSGINWIASNTSVGSITARTNVSLSAHSIRMGGDAAGFYNISSSGTAAYLPYIHFNTEWRMGVGTTTPQMRLDVTGRARFTDTMRVGDFTTYSYIIPGGALVQSSTREVKRNITDYAQTSLFDKVLAVNPVTWNFRPEVFKTGYSDSDTTEQLKRKHDDDDVTRAGKLSAIKHTGFIAEDWAAQFGGNGKEMNQSEITAVLWKTNQELIQRVRALEARVDKLEKKK